MRTTPVLLLGFLCLCVFTSADTQPADTKDEILQLGRKNFRRALRKHDQLLVYFTAPLTVQGQRVSEAFRGAAAELQGSEVKLAVIDVREEKALAEELNAGDHTIRLYLSGDKNNPVHCPAPQSSASILTWLKRRSGSAADLLTDLSRIETSEDLTVVGFFKEPNQEFIQMFHAAAVDLPDVNFALTQDDEVTSKYGFSNDVVFLLKKSKLIQAYKMRPQTSKEELIVFITVFQMDPVTEYTGQTASQILTSPVLNHALLFIKKSSPDFAEIYSAFNSAAEAFRLQILFVLVDVEEHRNGRMMEYFRVRDFEAPLIRLANLTNHVTYQLPSETLNVETITAFCQSYLQGTAEPKMQSQPIPEGWEKQPVKELVGMTLEKVAFNPNKTVLVLFYLPYNKASTALFPLWKELAEAVKDNKDIIIARMDASANDINMSIHRSYPSICLFPALYAERVVVYTGKQKLKDLVKFLEKEMEKAKKHRALEDENRSKYTEAMKAEEAKKDNKTKDEL